MHRYVHKKEREDDDDNEEGGRDQYDARWNIQTATAMCVMDPIVSQLQL